MRVLLMTNEFPPHIYGGAGVHVEYLSRELAKRAQVEVRSFHDQASDTGTLKVRGTKVPGTYLDGCPPTYVSPLKALQTCIAFNGQGIEADVVHCHTWYAQFGGILAKQLYQTPFVLTVHSLEPLRPWKREQLGNGYDLSAWVERTAIEMADAVVAVSSSTKADVLRLFDVPEERVPVIPNGIDVNEYTETRDPALLRRLGIDPERPFVLFVGRMTRQKGFSHLLDAIPALDPSFQVVLCGGDADTKELQAEMVARVDQVKTGRADVTYIGGMLDRADVIKLYSHATVFCCPSVYEPFGIINLEAMACGTPVVGSAVGGIAEVVVDGETGFLVNADLDPAPPHSPRDPAGFAARLAEGINRFAGNPELGAKMGAAGRRRVVDHYSWGSIADQTLALYEGLLARR
ncbi:MAG: glycogen synthase [Rhodospirillaceae bacterium]|nr:glycogen synthase [Rhodospirillaceae bacterium]